MSVRRRPHGPALLGLRPRWWKVVRDLTRNKTRTLLVVLSIAVGVFAFGVIMATRIVITRELSASFLGTNPASATLRTAAFDDELVDAARRVPGVAEAEGQRSLQLRIAVGPEQWYDLKLFVLPDDGETRIGIVRPAGGEWPPPKHELLIERASLPKTRARVGDSVTIEMRDGTQRQVRIAGLAHDLSLPPAPIAGMAFGYIDLDTAEWLGGSPDYNELQIVVAGGRSDKEHIRRVAREVEDKLERGGRTVEVTDIPEPLQHPAEQILPTLMLILTVLSVLALLLSGFLVVNTISSILAQQVRQIGMMKAIGARGGQIMRLYLGMVLAYGILGLLLALPLSWLGARAFTGFISGQLNIDILHFRLPPQVILFEAAAAILIPMLAALQPIRAASRITVREAMSSAGLSTSGGRPGRLDRFFERLQGVNGVGGPRLPLSRPLLLSLRNTFRRKLRLLLTLIALLLGGAIFVSVLTLRFSLFRTLDDSIAARRYDVDVRFARPYRSARLEAETLRVPGVAGVESWGAATAYPIRTGGGEGEGVTLHAPPATQLLRPDMLAGRWLLPHDEQAIVVSSNYLLKEPGTQVGSTIVLEIDGEEHTWQVVGISNEFVPPTTPAIAYVNYQYFARLTGEAGRATSVRVATAEHDAAAQAAVARALETHFEQAGLSVSSIKTTSEDRAQLGERFNILTAVLSIVALLIGTVGGLGLTGTMSINVLERTREIGVMRAIGASNGSVRRIVMFEGLLIGELAWLLGILMSLPISRALSFQIGNALLNVPLTYTYAYTGALLWLGIVTFLAAVASFAPAQRAVRLTVREVLAYE